MSSLRYLFILIALALLGYSAFIFWSIDEDTLQRTASGGVPARFIEASEETLEVLRKRLEEMHEVPRSLLEEPKKRSLGRKTLFLPDGATFSVPSESQE